MSVIAYTDRKDIETINAAVLRGLWSAHYIELHNPQDPDFLRQAGITVVSRLVGEKFLVASARSDDYVAVAKAIVLANASTYEHWYGERAELPNPWPTAATLPRALLKLKAECTCGESTIPQAFSVLNRVRYNVHVEAKGGTDAIALLKQLTDALAYEALAVDQIWKVM